MEGIKPTTDNATESLDLFENDQFLSNWRQHLLPLQHVRPLSPNWYVGHKKILNNTLTVKKLYLAGWSVAWSQILSPVKLLELTTYDAKKEWDCASIVWSQALESHQAFAEMEALGHHILQLPGPINYSIDITEGSEAWINQLSANTRKNLRRKLKKVQPFSRELLLLETPAETETFFEDFFRMHLQYWQEKTGFSYFEHPAERDFILGWVQDLRAIRHPHITPQLFVSTIEGVPVNLSLNIRFYDKSYGLLTINTGHYPELATGFVALYDQVIDAEKQGIHQLYQGPGDYEYKKHYCNLQLSTQCAKIANRNSTRGKLYLKWLAHQQARAKLQN